MQGADKGVTAAALEIDLLARPPHASASWC